MASWECNSCDEIHDTIQNSFAFDSPVYWGDRQRDSALEGCWIDDDYCVIDDRDRFIRAVLEIPVIDSDEVFAFGIWASVSAESFVRERSMAQNPSRVEDPPYFGWLSNRIWQYPDTLNLKCNLISQPPGLRPAVLVEPTAHALAVEQRAGISRERFIELSEQCIHGWMHPKSGIQRGDS